MLLSIITVSCEQEKTHNKINQEVSEEIGDSYYHRGYHCFDFVKQCELEMLKLTNYDTLIYVTSSQFHGRYEEIQGKMTKVNDSIYYVEPFRHIMQRGNREKPFRMQKDSVYFYCDSSLLGSNLIIEYLNGKIEEHKISSIVNVFWINEEYFNHDNERIYLSFDYKNPIVDETVEIVSKYSEMKYSISFRATKRLENFYVILNDENIKTLNIGNSGHQSSGPKFLLKKVSLNEKLPGNRKVYQ